MKNPMATGAQAASLMSPLPEPHSKNLHHPTHAHKVRHRGRKTVEMKRSHGARASAVGRDVHASSSQGAMLPGLQEPSGIMGASKGSSRFADMG